jgi:hypothetical protein
MIVPPIATNVCPSAEMAKSLTGNGHCRSKFPAVAYCVEECGMCEITSVKGEVSAISQLNKLHLKHVP